MFQSIRLLATCVFLINRCLCPCHPSHVLYITFIRSLYCCFPWMLPLLLLPCCTTTTTTSSKYCCYLRLMKHFHLYMANYKLASIISLKMLRPTLLWFLILWCSLCWKKKKNLWIKYNWKLFYHLGM